MEKEQQYDAYNANSRSVVLPALPDSLFKPQTHEKQTLIREDLPVEGARAFVLHNYLLPFECKYFIDATESKYKVNSFYAECLPSQSGWRRLLAWKLHP